MKDHIAVVGLGFGDEGKGTIVDWLCSTRPVQAVIRFNGGAQAGHNVVMADGRSHTFSQWGSGTFRGVPTHLSQFMIVNPISLIPEAGHLEKVLGTDPWRLLSIDERALVTTPYHQAVNIAKELKRGADRHGSCGVGVGETVSYSLAHPEDALRFGDLRNRKVLEEKLAKLYLWATGDEQLAVIASSHDSDIFPDVWDVADLFTEIATRVMITNESYLRAVLDCGQCVFEGAQGVLLDEWYGFHPHTTWSTTTFENVETLAGRGTFYRLGVVRAYTTRHGDGPMPSEDAGLTEKLVDPHNTTGMWQGPFRVGNFDRVLHRYAIKVCGGVDGLAITHLDIAEKYPDDLHIVGEHMSFEYGWAHLNINPNRENLRFQEELTSHLNTATPIFWDDLKGIAEEPVDWSHIIGAVLGAPVMIESRGPTAEDKRWVLTPDAQPTDTRDTVEV